MYDEVFGELVDVQTLGTGPRCETRLVWSARRWQPLVLKRARPDQTEHPRVRRALRREVAALAADPGHPALPRLLADRTRASSPYLLIEYVAGPTLAELVDDEGALDPADVARLAAQLLPAVAVLHARGLAHLDVKTENVLLRDGRPVLIDFGSSRPIGRRQPAGRPVGTAGYAAPEQEACEPVAAAMDLYGVGAVLAEALTGVPFPDAAPLPAGPVTAWVRRLVSEDPAARGTVAEALRAAGRLAGEPRLWPAEADALLVPGSRRRSELDLAHTGRHGTDG